MLGICHTWGGKASDMLTSYALLAAQAPFLITIWPTALPSGRVTYRQPPPLQSPPRGPEMTSKHWLTRPLQLSVWIRACYDELHTHSNIHAWPSSGHSDRACATGANTTCAHKAHRRCNDVPAGLWLRQRMWGDRATLTYTFPPRSRSVDQPWRRSNRPYREMNGQRRVSVGCDVLSGEWTPWCLPTPSPPHKANPHWII